MNIHSILRKDDVLINLPIRATKQAFCDLSEHLSNTHGLAQRPLYDALNARERLGSTCVGEGVSIPHARAVGIDQVHAVFARFENPIDMDAPDEKHVDLMMMIIAPEDDQNDHMKALARITRVLRDESNRNILRETESRDEIYRILTSCDI